MESCSSIGTDGFIATLPDRPFQAAYQAVIDDVCATLVAGAEPLLDGIYLYGSVAAGTAVPGRSDLDVTLILRHPASPQDRQTIESIRRSLQDRHPEVIKIDVDIGSRPEALAPENLFSWGYWLKHHCRCIWGNDLSEHFARFKPSRAIALGVNGDVEPVLTEYARAIEQANDLAEKQRLQREASRKLIRSTNILRTDQDQAWPGTLEEHVEHFLRAYPLMKPQINFFLAYAQNRSASSDEFSAELLRFTQWMLRTMHGRF